MLELLALNQSNGNPNWNSKQLDTKKHFALNLRQQMSLSFHFKFVAPAKKSASELEIFLKTVEKEAKRLGFNPTLVLKANFNTDERRAFARRLTSGVRVESTKLQGVVLVRQEQVFSHDSVHGECRLMPEQAVVLVATDERQVETVFGFFRYPKNLTDINGKTILETRVGGNWQQTDFVDSPDSRYRTIVKEFANAGYLADSIDEFAH